MTARDRIDWDIREHIAFLVEKHPNKRRQIHDALLSALELLSTEIQEVADNYLEMWDED